MDIDRLGFRDLIAVTEAILFEPAVNGSWSHIDEMLDKFSDALTEAEPDPETWGTGAGAQAAMRDLETMFAPADIEGLTGEATPDGPAEPTIPQ